MIQDELDYGLISLAVPILDDRDVLSPRSTVRPRPRGCKEELIRTRLPVLRNAARSIEPALRRQPYLLRSVHPD